jgi:hypothetical protein
MASRTRIALLFGGAASGLVPWIAVLAMTLPTRHVALHWSMAWSGFDVALAAVFAGVAVGAVRKAAWLGPAASVAGGLLVADAWFDMTTASRGPDFALALGMALLLELPLALVAFRIARRATHHCRGSDSPGLPRSPRCVVSVQDVGDPEPARCSPYAARRCSSASCVSVVSARDTLRSVSAVTRPRITP